MKKDKLSLLVLLVEIAAIIFLHTAKTRQPVGGMAHGDKKPPPATYQLKALPVTSLK